jgi:cytochrome c2
MVWYGVPWAVPQEAARAAGAQHEEGRMNRPAAGVLFVALAVLVAAPAMAQDAKVTKGQQVFEAQKCQMCHSVEGKGNKNHPLDGVGSTLKPEEIKKYIATPKEVKADSKMKAYPSLPADDLDALVAYVSSLKKKA